MSRIFSTLILLLFSFISFGQKVDPESLQLAKELNIKYPKETIVALQSVSTYNFYIDRKSDKLYAQHEEHHKYLALRPDAQFIKKNYFNDKSYIDDYSLETGRGKSLDYNKFCGHFQSDDIFYSDAQVCAYKFNLGMQGQVADFTAKTIYTDPKYLTYTFFNDEIPIEKREIIFHIPDYADIELVEMNFDGYDIKKVITKKEGESLYSYTLTNVDVMSDEKDAPGYLHYLPHILILTKSYQFNSKKISVLSSTDDLYAWYSTLTKQIVHNTKGLKVQVSELTDGLDTDREKIESIYYWVQDNIKYIAFENGLAAFKPEDADKVFYNRYGDCKGMANLTKEMLKLAGFDARLTWIGTNSIPYTYDIPTLAVDNHMICTVYADTKQYILDPTEKFNPLGLQAERIQGKQILIENGDSYILDTVRQEPLENYLQETQWHYQIEDSKLSGTGVSEMNGENRKVLLNYISSLNEEDKDKFLQAVISGNSNPDYFKIEHSSKFDRVAPFTISYDMHLDNNINQFGKEIYLDIDFYEEFKNDKLKADRHIPYSFGTREFNRTTAELVIPKGYKISYLPSPYSFKNQYYSFNLKYDKEDGKVIYTKEIQILKKTLPVAAFEEWNTAVSNLKQFYNDQIILTTAD